MNGTLRTLAERRRQLVARAARQRRELQEDLEVWRAPLAFADRGLDTARSIRRHWGWVVGGVLVLVALRPSRVGTWLSRGWWATRVLHHVRLRLADR